MIFIALGSNLPSEFGTPKETLEAALQHFSQFNIRVVSVSRWYETAPVPASDQPNYVNAVAVIKTEKPSTKILQVLHQIEHEFGRRRTVQNAARSIDLDLIDCCGEVRDEAPILPHPRMHERGFVLFPLRDVAPKWIHPQTGQNLEELIAKLPKDQQSVEDCVVKDSGNACVTGN